jgi:hypothetical protein
MRWVWSLGGLVVGAVLIGWLANPTVGWLLGLFGSLGVLFAWRTGVVGNASESWARNLYGPDAEDREGSGYADLMGRHLGRQHRTGKARRRR